MMEFRGGVVEKGWRGSWRCWSGVVGGMEGKKANVDVDFRNRGGMGGMMRRWGMFCIVIK